MKRNIRIFGLVITVFSIGLLTLWGCRSARDSYDSSMVTIEDTLPDGAGREATVIILAGQSNASGASRDDYLRQNVTAEQYAEYESGYANVYINYVAGANVSNGFVPCGVRQGENEDFFGPELGMADKLNEVAPDRTFFIIKCAWGGSNLHHQWLSPTSFGRTGELYRSFVTFVKANLAYLERKNYDVKIEAMCWMQGESDACLADKASAYGKHLKNLMKDVRKEFKAYASEDGIGFVDALIADNPSYWVHYELVNEAKRSVAGLSDRNALIDTVALGLSCSEEPEGAPDMAHYDSLSELQLGHEFAEKAIAFFDP